MSQEITEQFRVFYTKRAKDWLELLCEEFVNHEWLDPLLVNADLREIYLHQIEEQLANSDNLEFNKVYSKEELNNERFHMFAVAFYKRIHNTIIPVAQKPVAIGMIIKQKPKDFVKALEPGKCYDLPVGMSSSSVINAGYKQGMKISVSMIEGKWIVYRRA